MIDTAGSDMCFPADHPAWRGLRYGVDEAIRTADVVLVIDCDVPWINTQCRPREDAAVFHVDVDPLKQQMPVFYIDALMRCRADGNTALGQICRYIEGGVSTQISGRDGEESSVDEASQDGRSTTQQPAKSTPSAALSTRKAEHDAMFERLDGLAVPNIPKSASLSNDKSSSPTFPCAYLCRRLRALCPANTIWCVEAVTNMVVVADQIRPCAPGTWFNCGGGGLGWSGGAALGLALAARDMKKKNGCGNVESEGVSGDYVLLQSS